MVGINFQRIIPLCVLNYSFFKANHIINCVQLCYGMLYFFRNLYLFIILIAIFMEFCIVCNFKDV